MDQEKNPLQRRNSNAGLFGGGVTAAALVARNRTNSQGESKAQKSEPSGDDKENLSLRVGKLSLEKDKLSKQLEAVTKEKNDLQAENTLLQDKVAKSESSGQEAARLKQDLENSNKTLETSIANASNLQKELEQKNLEIKSLKEIETTAKNATNRAVASEENLQKKQAENKRLTEEVSQKDAEITKLTQDKQGLEQEKVTWVEDKARLENQVKAMQKHNDGLSAQVKRQDESLESLTQENIKLKAASELQKSDVASKDTQLQTQQEAIEKLKREKAALQEEVTALQKPKAESNEKDEPKPQKPMRETSKPSYTKWIVGGLCVSGLAVLAFIGATRTPFGMNFMSSAASLWGSSQNSMPEVSGIAEVPLPVQQQSLGRYS